MAIKTLAAEAPKKGIRLLGSGDCLHPLWMKELKEACEKEEGLYTLGEVAFVLQTEVEDERRVHHVLLFPDMACAEGFAEKVKHKGAPLDSDGRPKLHMSGEEIAQLAQDTEALIGPSHAFTPWTGIYAHHDSLRSCYGELADKVKFAELGLSADTSYADRISELHPLAYLTNSDAHSPYPNRLAREFNRLEINALSFEDLKKALLRSHGCRIALNVGLPPQEGKYNESACIKCYAHYTLHDAKALGWRCRCGGVIKKGVKDRVEELATLPPGRHPAHRPRYVHLIPLGEIISMALGTSSPNAKQVSEIWGSLVARFGSEIIVLLDAPVDDIAPREIAEAIAAFRAGRVKVLAGGGGRYGKIYLEDAPAPQMPKSAKGQMALFDFER
ncbi:MAG: TIGR00375 family protein [Candidatus Thermoplasmatota archaeon]